MADKLCANCGAEVPAAAVFCTQCGGRDLIEASVPPPPGGMPAPPVTEIVPDAPTMPVEADPPPSSAVAAPGPFPGSPSAPAPQTIAEQPVMDEPTISWAPVPQPASGPPMPQPTAMASPFEANQTRTPAPMPPPTPGTTGGGGGKLGAVIVLLGGAAAIVGAFLSWMTITPVGLDAIALSGWTLSDDAKIAVALGAVAVVAAMVVLGGSLRGPVRIVAAIVGIVLVGLGAYDTYDILNKLPDSLESAGVSGVEIAAPQIGLILVLAGGAVILLGALAMSGGKKPAAVPTDPMAASQAGGPLPPGPASAPPVGGYPTTPGGFGTMPSSGYGTPPGGYAPPSGGTAPPTTPFR